MKLLADRREQKYRAKRELLARDAASDILCNSVHEVKTSWVFIGRSPRNVNPLSFMRDVGTLATELSGSVQTYDHASSEEFSLRFNEHDGQLEDGDRLFLVFKNAVEASVELVPVI